MVTEANIQTVEVKLAERGYKIFIGGGLTPKIGDLISPLLGVRQRVVTILDQGAANSHRETLCQSLAAANIEQVERVIPAGETTKSWHQLQTIVEWLIERKVERLDTVMAFGGGVTGDLVGFASAILRRGVNYIQVPSTLLAQVDSSVGGKTGINSPIGKNLIGAFHQPKLVICDVHLLKTLPHRDFLSGLGEVVKYGIISDKKFFVWLEKNAAHLSPERDDLMSQMVRRSCQIKAEIVASDEKERSGRAILNLGHTFAHALEVVTGYSDRLLHGEAVAMGCCLALKLSHEMGFCQRDDWARTRALFRSLQMKTAIHEIGGEMPRAGDIIDLIHQDKKVTLGRPRFVLARGLGDAFVTDQVDLVQVQEVLENSLSAPH